MYANLYGNHASHAEAITSPEHQRAWSAKRLIATWLRRLEWPAGMRMVPARS